MWHLNHEPVNMNAFDLSTLQVSGMILLLFFLFLVLFFEFVNGFHDTANAVATVIYTKSLQPNLAVAYSGMLNLLGVIMGGTGVAMGMVKLLPMNDLMAMPFVEIGSFVGGVLITAIAWNLGTWYFGIPCSSSHTMIGSMLGAGIAFFWVHGGEGVNWEKASEVGLALLFSPLFGCLAAMLLMFLAAKLIRNKEFFEAPTERAPKWWIRSILIATCGFVSFFHGSNDGQKGISLFMIVLMMFLPAQFALHKSFDAAALGKQLDEIQSLSVIISEEKGTSELYTKINEGVEKLRPLLTVPTVDRVAVRKELGGLVKSLGKVAADEKGYYSDEDKAQFKGFEKKLKSYTDYAPWFVVILISLALGIGTMIGWKRIVVTIGEKIGKTHLTYAQGASAEIIAAITIALSTFFKAPVSTTHVLSSAVAGTMIAKNGTQNLQRSTLTNILLAWVLTLPVTMLGAGGLFYLFRAVFG